ncbi:hemin uptake protein HemP [Roseibium limicola]|uniref:Hemin uptake protein HemP n=1 Tax=Roseibium limicola TaxID=2816037 RepID=A0A939J8W8_9HYPH|nr:hemin uptake protein HemP [Roseibium limicola]MBO0345741.1 hemin uptake protein HemP [Roseibium limicola]
MHSTKVRRDKLSISGLSRPQPSYQDSHDLVLDTKALFKGQRELKIQHNSEVYRLSITKLGKLILTK